MMHGTQTYISSCVQPQHYLNFALTEVAFFPGRAGGQGPTDAGLTSAQFSLAYERHERVGKISAANASHKTPRARCLFLPEIPPVIDVAVLCKEGACSADTPCGKPPWLD